MVFWIFFEILNPISSKFLISNLLVFSEYHSIKELETLSEIPCMLLISSLLASKIFLMEPKVFTRSLEVCLPTYLIPSAGNNFSCSEFFDFSIASSKFLVFFSFHCGKEISSS